MPVLISPSGTGWTVAPGLPGPDGPVVGFDTTLGRPVWRHPSGTSWVDALGNVVAGVLVGQFFFDCSENSGLLAVL